MIAACTELSDYRRATEWTDRAERWMGERGVGGYPSVCQVHRAELKLLSGNWPEAMEEALHACEELERFRLLNDAGFARYEIGEVKRRMGDLAGAEEAFTSAYEYRRSTTSIQVALGDGEGTRRDSSCRAFGSLRIS